MAKTPSKSKTPKKTRTSKKGKAVSSSLSSLSEGCTCCEGKPGGTLFYCEDNTTVDIPVPGYQAFLIYDPTRLPNSPIFWCRPAAVPVNAVQELFTALIANMTEQQKLDLASVLVLRMNGTVTCDCEGHSCSCIVNLNAV